MATGVTTKVAEKVIEYLHDALRSQSPEAQRKAAENTRLFLSDLADRVAHVEGQLALPRDEYQSTDLEGALSDPDFTLVFRSAALAGARTESRTKHGALASAVAQRLKASAESLEAVAASAAVEAVPTLAEGHLDLLGLLSFLYAVRPPGVPIRQDAPNQRRTDVTPEEYEAAATYARWFSKTVASYGSLATPADADLVHIVSAGCIVLERRQRRDLNALINPFGNRVISTQDASPTTHELWTSLRTPAGVEIQKVWEHYGQHVTPTPAGLLIGAAAIEARTGEPAGIDWSSRLVTQFVGGIDDSAWDGRNIDKAFWRKLEREFDRLLRSKLYDR